MRPVRLRSRCYSKRAAYAQCVLSKRIVRGMTNLSRFEQSLNLHFISKQLHLVLTRVKTLEKLLLAAVSSQALYM